MCTIISSDLVIGNLLIEAIKNDNSTLNINEIINFEDKLNIEFENKAHNCYSDIKIDEIYNTINIFSDIFTMFNNDITISVDNKKESILKSLISFFRSGLPSSITELFRNVYDSIFQVNEGKLYG